jgi:acid stress chaperone HdeB
MKAWLLLAMVLLVSLLVSPLATPPARAQATLDVAKITCGDFAQDKITDTMTLAVWLSGYAHGLQNSTVVDVTALRKNRDIVWQYCESHRSMSLMDAAKEVLSAGK